MAREDPRLQLRSRETTSGVDVSTTETFWLPGGTVVTSSDDFNSKLEDFLKNTFESLCE